MRPKRSMAVLDDALTVWTTHRICDERQPLAAGSFDALDRPDDVRLGTRSADDRSARLGEHPGDALADTLPSAGDDRYLPVQPELLQRHAHSSAT